MPEVCAACGLEVDVAEEEAKVEAHDLQLHFPFVTYCPDSQPRHENIFLSLYDTPWDTSSTNVFVCSGECDDAYCHSGEFVRVP